MTTLQRLTYTVEEVGELLGISRGSAYNRVRTGEIPALRMGRRLLVSRAELEALLGSAPPPPGNLANERSPVHDIETALARRTSWLPSGRDNAVLGEIPAHRVELSDGRGLAYAEYGEDTGSRAGAVR